jgi:hypothetical protein
MQTGTYYLGRVIKNYFLNQELFIKSLFDAKTITTRNYSWTITECMKFEDDGKITYIFGRLSKFNPDGEVGKVDRTTKSEIRVPEPDLLVASSPFIYIPEYSGIAFLHIWNQIEDKTFISRFCQIIVASNENVFTECIIEPLTDLQTFLVKIKTLTRIYQISATINPPNPLFSPLWKPLRDYLRERDTHEMRIEEKNKNKSPIKTKIVDIIQRIIEIGAAKISRKDKESNLIEEPVPTITEAALLMAADGYGKGKISGIDTSKKIVVVRTAETTKSFIFSKDPEPQALYKISDEHFRNVSDQRRMRH